MLLPCLLDFQRYPPYMYVPFLKLLYLSITQIGFGVLNNIRWNSYSFFCPFPINKNQVFSYMYFIYNVHVHVHVNNVNTMYSIHVHVHVHVNTMYSIHVHVHVNNVSIHVHVHVNNVNKMYSIHVCTYMVDIHVHVL